MPETRAEKKRLENAERHKQLEERRAVEVARCKSAPKEKKEEGALDVLGKKIAIVAGLFGIVSTVVSVYLAFLKIPNERNRIDAEVAKLQADVKKLNSDVTLTTSQVELSKAQLLKLRNETKDARSPNFAAKAPPEVGLEEAGQYPIHWTIENKKQATNLTVLAYGFRVWSATRKEVDVPDGKQPWNKLQSVAIYVSQDAVPVGGTSLFVNISRGYTIGAASTIQLDGWLDRAPKPGEIVEAFMFAGELADGHCAIISLPQEKGHVGNFRPVSDDGTISNEDCLAEFSFEVVK
ncbi:MAG TPA: hypothetical protein VF516_16545 [Kofleriaceae bacterium]